MCFTAHVSLTVTVFVTDENGNVLYLDSPPGSDLAGGERTRQTLWGSAFVRSLGARFLPRLDTTDGFVFVLPDEVPEFLNECAMIWENVPLIATNTDHDEDYIRSRLVNIMMAARRAHENAGGVSFS